MLKCYLKTILRQIQKHRLFSSINILGLILGMAACLVIAQYVLFLKSFDDFHGNANSIFRIEPGWWFYIIPILFVVGMASLSIIFNILGTIKTSPVKSLRYA